MSGWKPSAWMPFFIADYLADTQHLNTQQHGAYCLLLFASWNRGGSLPDDDEVLRVVTRLSTKEWKAHRPVLEEFFGVKDGRWVQKRLQAEMQKAITTTHRRREAGANGAERRWRGEGKEHGKANSRAVANSMAKPSQSDANSELRTQTDNKNLLDGPASAREVAEIEKWAPRLAGYRPWEGKTEWSPHWGLRPDSAGLNPLIPNLLLKPWLADWQAWRGQSKASAEASAT